MGGRRRPGVSAQEAHPPPGGPPTDRQQERRRDPAATGCQIGLPGESPLPLVYINDRLDVSTLQRMSNAVLNVNVAPMALAPLSGCRPLLPGEGRAGGEPAGQRGLHGPPRGLVPGLDADRPGPAEARS